MVLHMIRLKRTIGACILASVLSSCQAIPAHTATYYVDTTGSNSNPGTEKKPWRTVAYAVDNMVAGDTTYVRTGTYNEGLIRFKNSGTQTAPIRLLNYPGESPVIDFVDKSQYHRVLLQHRSGYQNPIGWIMIEGFEIRDGSDGIKFHNSHDITIRGNWIHDNTPGQGILGNGTRILIDRNRINHNGNFAGCAITQSECNKDHGIYASGTSFTITNNLIYDNLAYGIQVAGVHPYDRSKHAGPEYVLSADWIIANNTLAYNANRSGIVIWGSTCNNAQIYNNIFYENGVNIPNWAANGIDFVGTTCTGIQIKNNLSYASGAGAEAFLSQGAKEGVHYTQSGNIVNVSDPAFANAPPILPDSPNFALTERSPAIDKGLPLATIKVAVDGTARPQGRAHDIGAYEYVPDADARSPMAPRALRAD